jgi:hypothetical protein
MRFAGKQNPMNKLFASITLIPILLASLYGYYHNIAAMKGEGAVSSLRDALAYVEANWQPGDIIYATDDGPWVNVTPYTDKPIYRMPGCDQEKTSYAPVLGSLSDRTRQAIGMNIADLGDIPHERAWVFSPFSPLHPECYRRQVAQIFNMDQVAFVVDDNDWLYSGVWLVEE